MNNNLKAKLTDKEIEEIWNELDNVPFDENPLALDSCGLVLGVDYFEWKKGMARDLIWKWFDMNHSKGIVYLLEDYYSESDLKDNEDIDIKMAKDIAEVRRTGKTNMFCVNAVICILFDLDLEETASYLLRSNKDEFFRLLKMSGGY
jgi:hypothetical protein